MAESKIGLSIQLGTIPNIKTCPGGIGFLDAGEYPVVTCPECGGEYCTITCPLSKEPTGDPCRLERRAANAGISCARCLERSNGRHRHNQGRKAAG